MVQVEIIIHLLRITVVLLLIVVIGKENNFIKIEGIYLFLSVHHQKQQHLIVVQAMMVMLKNVLQMRKQYQVINFLIKIPMYVYIRYDKKLNDLFS